MRNQLATLVAKNYGKEKKGQENNKEAQGV